MEHLWKASDAIYVAAADSSETDQQIADYICDGKDDQYTIQKAVDEITKREKDEVRGKRICLLSGNYYISDFPQENAWGKAAVIIDNVTNAFEHI